MGFNSGFKGLMLCDKYLINSRRRNQITVSNPVIYHSTVSLTCTNVRCNVHWISPLKIQRF